MDWMRRGWDRTPEGVQEDPHPPKLSLYRTRSTAVLLEGGQEHGEDSADHPRSLEPRLGWYSVRPQWGDQKAWHTGHVGKVGGMSASKNGPKPDRKSVV